MCYYAATMEVAETTRNKKTSLFVYLLAMTLVLAFCSLVYELLLGQILSAFLGNTILRYSVTVGLYMAAMGLGAYLAKEASVSKTVSQLLRVELALTLFGGGAVLLMFLLFAAHVPPVLFLAIAHLYIILIGVLTGFEIPLLITLGNKSRPDSENIVLGVDYLGAFLGAILFAFYFYPTLGLVASTFVLGLLNALVGIYIGILYPDKRNEVLEASLIVVAALLIVGLFFSHTLTEFFVTIYLLT